MIPTMSKSPRYIRDIKRYQKYKEQMSGRRLEKFNLLFDTYVSFARQIDEVHSSQFSNRVDPRLARDARNNLNHTRAQLEKIILELDN